MTAPVYTYATEDHLHLLLEFQALPKVPKIKTFMDVSGYPHYENVSSNLLAFFFDPEQEHGLGDLLLTSFLSLSTTEEHWCKTGVTIHREHGTDGGEFLDLLIEGEDFVIGIENKIYHHLANDLTDYAALLGRFSHQRTIKAVLSLKSINAADGLRAGFVSYTYTQFWCAVRQRIGRYIHAAHPKWLSYLIDFMETTANLAGENKSIKAREEFLVRNEEIISELVAERQGFIDRLNGNIWALKEIMDQAGNSPTGLTKRWIWKRDACLVHDFVFDTYQICFELACGMGGWNLYISDRANSLSYLRELIGKEPLLSKMLSTKLIDGRSYHAATWPFDTSLDVMHSAQSAWIDALLVAADVSSLPRAAQATPRSLDQSPP